MEQPSGSLFVPTKQSSLLCACVGFTCEKQGSIITMSITRCIIFHCITFQGRSIIIWSTISSPLYLCLSARLCKKKQKLDGFPGNLLEGRLKDGNTGQDLNTCSCGSGQMGQCRTFIHLIHFQNQFSSLLCYEPRLRGVYWLWLIAVHGECGFIHGFVVVLKWMLKNHL